MGGQGQGQQNKGLLCVGGILAGPRLHVGLGSSVWQSSHGLIQAACWAQHPRWYGAWLLGHVSAAVGLRPSGLGKREPERA